MTRLTDTLFGNIWGLFTWSPEWKAISLAYSSQRELDSWQADAL